MTEAPSTQPRSQRTALIVIGAVALIVVGFAIGFLAQLPLGGDKVTIPASDSVDVGFAQDMSVHHNQAIQMATIGYTNSTDPVVRNLAYDILTTQQNQVGEMQGWLSLWDMPRQPTGGYMGWMTEHDDEHSMGTMAHSDPEGPVAIMPGMASSEDLTRLRTATRTDGDVLFLQLMLRHHEGGLEMLEYGAQYADTPQVRRLARSMVDTQTTESAQMTQLLTERGAQPL